MYSRLEWYLWLTVFTVLIALGIPWFLWGNDRIIAALPIWLWWHIGWIVVTATTFWVFTKRAWGVGIVGVER